MSKLNTIQHNALTNLFLQSVTYSKIVGPMIPTVFVTSIPMSFWIAGNLMESISQIFLIHAFSRRVLQLQNIMRTIRLGILPQRVLFKQNFGRQCVWNWIPWWANSSAGTLFLNFLTWMSSLAHGLSRSSIFLMVLWRSLKRASVLVVTIKRRALTSLRPGHLSCNGQQYELSWCLLQS